MFGMFGDPSQVDTSVETRSVSFENPTGAKGSGGSEAGGRKGAAFRRIEPDERVVLADLEGPGVIRHIWLTVPPAPPEVLRALALEVTYDDLDGPSVSVPLPDFFGVPHGRPCEYTSALTAIQEGRGFNAYFPMPFRRRVRIEFANRASRFVNLYYQVDLTLEDVPQDRGLLHVSWRRQNPTVLGEDFVIVDGLAGPGRFLGCCVGVRPIDAGTWYGEGEVKMYIDGDTDLPTVCGTGLEDYVGTAWGMGAHAATFAGAPLDVRAPGGVMPDYVGFYRWHVPDPVVFREDFRVTIQQIGYAMFGAGQEAEAEEYARTNPPAGHGWIRNDPPGMVARGTAERVDDYCAAAFVYCLEPQRVPVPDLALVTADISRRDHEHPTLIEQLLSLEG